MKAIVFDLGDTLIEYEGVPLSWEAHYPAALHQLSGQLGLSIDASQLAAGCAVLRKYNTRLNPRAHEITFSAILAELCASWKTILPLSAENHSARTFFQVFRQRLRCFPETKRTLQWLRQEGFRIGIFTDVPYGMPRELVLEDGEEAGIGGLYDVLLTSRDVGYRKPSPQTLIAIAAVLNCPLSELVHIGNEKKDIEVALALGCRPVLINRTGKEIDWGQHHTIGSLTELAEEKILGGGLE